MMIPRRSMTNLAILLGVAGGGVANGADANYDESRVPSYVLPDPLTFADGRHVGSSAEWRSRRAEILGLFQREMYGRSPGRPARVSYEVDIDGDALGGKATRKQVSIRLGEGPRAPVVDLLLYIPNGAVRPIPAFIGMNFGGNQTITADPGVRLARSWVRKERSGAPEDHRATEDSRGTAASRWPVATLLARGYALATIYYGDLEPDHPEGWRSGVRSVFPADAGDGVAPANDPIGELAPDAWGAVGAWAWGLSRGLDYLETDPDIDARHVAVMGHSRLGKTALWAGATDERFAIVISNDSGCGGAALSRRAFGETVERINTSFPHWFCANFKKYNGREADLPVDQHELIALMAPRPVYIASAEKDQWADPRGEFLSGKAAGPVYQLLGRKGLGVGEMPGIHEPAGDFVAYHIRAGVHDVTSYDWERYLDFADRHFGRTGHP